MQPRKNSKSKLQQYFSIKQFETIKQQPKKQLKNQQSKSKLKNKNIQHSNSQSKIKPIPQNIKNNQNKNTINFQTQQNTKVKKNNHEQQIFKKNIKKKVKATKTSRVSGQKIIRTKSTDKLLQYKQKNKEHLYQIQNFHSNEEKNKINRGHTHRSQKQKKGNQISQNTNTYIKRTGSLSTILSKKHQIPQRNVTSRGSIKTENSSKTTSVMRQQQKLKNKKKKTIMKKCQSSSNINMQNIKQKKSNLQLKIQKSILYSQVSFQQFCQQQPYQSTLVYNNNYYMPVENKVKTQGAQIIKNYPCRLSFSQNLQQIAAIKIQKVFRGYITRKYIQQIKYIYSKIKIIQKWWRRMLKKKQKKQPKINSIESSLITIKDFNQTIKNEKRNNFSQSKQQTQCKKINLRQLINNILQQNNEDNSIQQHNENIQIQQSNLDNSILNKKIYIQHKIKDQISSQRSFNSPKHQSPMNTMKTPTNRTDKIKQFFSDNQKSKLKQKMLSPRLSSPANQAPPPKTTPKSHKRQQYLKQQQIQIKKQPQHIPFDSGCHTIEQLCIISIKFIQNNSQQLHTIFNKIINLKYQRTKLILKTWNTSTNQDQDQKLYQYLQFTQISPVFNQKIKKHILTCPQIVFFLNQKNIDLYDKFNQQIIQGFLKFIFDVFEQAIYAIFRPYVLTWSNWGKTISTYDTKIFLQIISEALGQMSVWSDLRCGLLTQQGNEYYNEQKQTRFNEYVKKLDEWDMGLGSILGIKMQISEFILMDLLDQLIISQMFNE